MSQLPAGVGGSEKEEQVSDWSGSTFAMESPFIAGSPVVFTISEHPEPGLYEGECNLCGGWAFGPDSFATTIAALAAHVEDVHGVVEP